MVLNSMFHKEFHGIKFYAKSSILLIWQAERKRKFHGIREEFHPHKTHLAQLPSFQS